MVLKLAGVVTVIAGIFVFFASSSEPLPGSLIGPPSLSPDGRIIAFTYGKTIENNHLLIYDIDSEELRLIDKPPHLFVRRPSFSHDGERLAIATYCNEACEPEEQNHQIATVDLDSGELSFVTSGRDFVRTNPVFSSDGGKVFFAAFSLYWRDEWIAQGRRWHSDWGNPHRRAYCGVSRVSTETYEEVRLPASSGEPMTFFRCMLGGATNEGDMYFSAVSPKDDTVQQAIAEMGRKADTLGYVLRSSGELELLPQNVDWPMSSISSPADGKTQIFISSPATDRYKYDLYQLIDGNVSQISFLGTHMSFASVSADGQTVVFLADAQRQRNWSIWIHNLVSGETALTLQHERIMEFLGLSPETK